jgi:hypothetical protein
VSAVAASATSRRGAVQEPERRARLRGSESKTGRMAECQRR